MQLPAISYQRQLFSILALDDILSLSQILSLDLSLNDNLIFLTKVLNLLLELSREASGIVFDPIYSLPLISYKAKNAGALIRLEQHQDLDVQAIPQLFPNFSLLEIKNNYALAKLAINYQAHEEQALAKKQLLAEIRDYSQSLKIDFLLKLNANFDNQDIFISSIQEVQNFTDILVLEGIDDPLLAATISSELDVPWLLSASDHQQLTYTQFKNNLRIAMENGAKGFYLGSFLWQDLAQFRQDNQEFEWSAVENFVRGSLRDKVIELNRIAEELAI
jgi:tagatose-1,6-bisphosphate aldolase